MREREYRTNDKMLTTDKLKKVFRCNGIIESITESDYQYEWIGYKIDIGNSNDIVMKISRPKVCCEKYGIYADKTKCNDNIGATISKVNIYERHATRNYIFTETSILVELVTDKGNLEFTIYCSHEGYYSHEYYIRVNNEIINGNI